MEHRDDLKGAYLAIKRAAEPFAPRVQAVAHTALLAECIAGAFQGDDEEIFASLRKMITAARAQRPQ